MKGSKFGGGGGGGMSWGSGMSGMGGMSIPSMGSMSSYMSAPIQMPSYGGGMDNSWMMMSSMDW